MEPVENVLVKTKEVNCDGGDGSLGHPMIYLSISKTNKIDCPYCGRRFIFEDKAA